MCLVSRQRGVSRLDSARERCCFCTPDDKEVEDYADCVTEKKSTAVKTCGCIPFSSSQVLQFDSLLPFVFLPVFIGGLQSTLEGPFHHLLYQCASPALFKSVTAGWP